MAAIRFVHAGDLRLGAALEGVGTAPTWLQQTLRSAVRQAVCNLCDAALSARADFVLFSGTLCAHTEDMRSAAAWLRPQINRLHEHGIRTVGHSDAHIDTGAELFSHTIRPGEHLAVRQAAAGGDGADVRVERDLSFGGAHLIVTADRLNPDSIRRSTDTVLHYRAAASGSAVNSSFTNGEGELRCHAGPVQSTSPAEPGGHGVLMVSADPESGTMSVRPAETGPVRYEHAELRLSGIRSFEEIRSEIRELVRRHDAAVPQTVLLDVIVRSEDVTAIGAADDRLFTVTRESLKSDHHGVWIRGLSCIPNTPEHASRLAFGTVSGAAAETLCRMSDSGFAEDSLHAGLLAEDVRRPLKWETLIAGLDLLRRAA